MEEQPRVPLTLIEFKRPGRQDYPTAENPIVQIFSYVEKLRTSSFEDLKGRSMQRISDDQRIDCFLIADITDALERHIRNHDGQATPEGDGFIVRNSTLGAEIRITSYQRLIEDAEIRHKTFFEFLENEVSHSQALK